MNTTLINITEQVLLAFDRIRQAGEQLASYFEASTLVLMKPGVFQKRSLPKSSSPKDGLYYLVLIDMIGSTRYLSEYGNAAAMSRIQRLMKGIRLVCDNLSYEKKVCFLKEVGDAALLSFEAFADVVRFREGWEEVNRGSSHIEVRICIHCGEMNFDEGNPIGLAVSELFKMEKQVGGGETVLSPLAACLGKPSLDNDLSPYVLNFGNKEGKEMFFLIPSNLKTPVS